MPEPVELCVGGRERRGMAMTEADDGDPGQEVQVRAAVGVIERRPVAAGERQILAGVDRKNW